MTTTHLFHGPFRIALESDDLGAIIRIATTGGDDIVIVREDLDDTDPPRVWIDRKRTQEDR